MTDKIALQNAEFDALDRLTETYRQADRDISAAQHDAGCR